MSTGLSSQMAYLKGYGLRLTSHTPPPSLSGCTARRLNGQEVTSLRHGDQALIGVGLDGPESNRRDAAGSHNASLVGRLSAIGHRYGRHASPGPGRKSPHPEGEVLLATELQRYPLRAGSRQKGDLRPLVPSSSLSLAFPGPVRHGF